MGFGVAAVGLEATGAVAGVGPAGRDREDLLMKPDGARAGEREAAELDDAGYGVGGLGEACTGEIVMHKALGEEPAEQSLHEPVLEVELD